MCKPCINEYLTFTTQVIALSKLDPLSADVVRTRRALILHCVYRNNSPHCTAIIRSWREIGTARETTYDILFSASIKSVRLRKFISNSRSFLHHHYNDGIGYNSMALFHSCVRYSNYFLLCALGFM